MSPRVSIVTPTRNSESTIVETLDAVSVQSFGDFEHIIVDDASTDKTLDLIAPYIDADSRVRLIQLGKNSGAAVARNAGIQQSRGRYIAFLDSDDLWQPTKLERQLDFMIQGEVPFSYSSYNQIDENGAPLGAIMVPERQSYSDLLKNNRIGCLTVIYDTQFFGKVFMPLIHKRQDLGLWLKLLKKTPYAYGMQANLAQYRVHPNAMSSDKFDAAKYTWRLYRDIEKLPIGQALYYFSFYVLNGVAKTYLRSRTSGVS